MELVTEEFCEPTTEISSRLLYIRSSKGALQERSGDGVLLMR